MPNPMRMGAGLGYGIDSRTKIAGRTYLGAV